MGEDGLSKGQNQRKRRQERESCINNVKLNPRRLSRPSIDNSTYTKHSRNKFQRGSLENVSTDPWTDPQRSSLRRSRSLAITRDDVFTSLTIQDTKPRRAQLIPRAKLIERPKEPRYAVVRHNSRDRTPRISITPPDYSPPRPATEAIYSSINNLTSPKFIIDKENDSLDSNFNNKSSINTGYRVSYEELGGGLSLPNYYPDSKYDTDNTDAISLADDLSSYGDASKKYSSCDNISTRWVVAEAENISYDDNIVLSANRPLYDSIRDKPKTIRGPTSYNSDKQIFYKEKLRECKTATQENRDSDNDNISLEYFETDTNLDEIKLNNENITKTLEAEEQEETYDYAVVEQLKTNIEVVPPGEGNEEYKTIVNVDPDLEAHEEKNKHSHNYLRELFETQKGSKKPLQNFLTKKLTNLSRKSTNLIDNRFYSLPDLATSKSLKKCEKIDRKLRKCDKNTTKQASEKHANRFIVNIGRHFDITANTDIPVDFELKIAKVPRKNRNKKPKSKPEEQLIEAVRNLKETLKVDENHNVTKPEIVAIQRKMDTCTKEYHDKLGTMRNYWDKMINGKDDETCDISTKCKIVDVQTKFEDAKKMFEHSEHEPDKPNKVQITKMMFERKPFDKNEKLSPLIKETCNYFEAPRSNQYESLNANIVEIVSKEDPTKQHKPVTKAMSITDPEFDHVRYRVVKSDLFQKKIFANCEKESQFDGLMQYLQDYSFQELLRDNNIVIIEPIRTKIPYENTKKATKTPKNVTPLLHKQNKNDENGGLKRHFFYHPIRVNKEVNDDELPNPDMVKQVRQLFEGGLTRSRSSEDVESVDVKCTPRIDPDKDHCSATDTNSNSSNISDFGSNENLYDSLTDHCCEQYVSEDVLAKIRECGTTVTYYGGRVVKKQSGQPVLTKAIMEEIKNQQQRNGECLYSNNENDNYQGVKFRLIKSNSCNSRLELLGTADLKAAKQKYMKLKEVKELENKNAINENMNNVATDNQPRIIGEERKMTQWSKDNNYGGISFNSKSKADLDYHNYDNLKQNSRKMDEMEFEPYEVA